MNRLYRTDILESDGHAEGITLYWTCFGLDERWVEDHLVPACEACALPLVRVAQPASVDRIGEGEDPWDVLFLGEGEPAAETRFLERLREAAHSRPMSVAIAVTPSASLGRQLALLRAGALDVLSLNLKTEQVHDALSRARELIQARRAAVDAEKFRLVNQLSVSINHEINNPLAGLMGTAELLIMENRQLPEKARRDLDVIIKQCQRIQEVTTRLKHLTRLRTVPYGAHDLMLDLIGEPAPQPAHEALAAQEQERSDPQFLPTPRLLVVDDNPLIADLVTRLFEHTYQIESSGSATEALAKAERRTFDLVLIDLILPEMNGLELFRLFRQSTAEQKVLLMTAYHGDPRIDQALAEGALGCVYKPFQLEELQTALATALRA